MTTNDNATLYLLGDRGQTVDESLEDVRGRQVADKNGDGIGKVAGLLVDDRDHKVRFLLVEHGGFLGFGETKSLIPVGAITKITEDTVLVDQSRERIAEAPPYSPELINDRPHHARVYGLYGYPSDWGGTAMNHSGMTMPLLSPPPNRR